MNPKAVERPWQIHWCDGITWLDATASRETYYQDGCIGHATFMQALAAHQKVLRNFGPDRTFERDRGVIEAKAYRVLHVVTGQVVML